MFNYLLIDIYMNAIATKALRLNDKSFNSVSDKGYIEIYEEA